MNAVHTSQRTHSVPIRKLSRLITFMEINGVFKAHSRHCKKRLLTTSPSVCLSVRKKQCGAYLDGFSLISYFTIFFIRPQNSSLFQIWRKQRVLYMKTCVHLWQSLAEFLQWKMFQTKVVEEIKTHILRTITFPRKSCRLWHNVGKCDRVTQAPDGNIVLRMRFACWIPKPTDTYSEYVILIVFPRQQWLRDRATMLRNQCIAYLVCLIHTVNINTRLDKLQSLAMLQNVVYIVTTVFWMVRHVYFWQEMATDQIEFIRANHVTSTFGDGLTLNTDILNTACTPSTCICTRDRYHSTQFTLTERACGPGRNTFSCLS
jgi:hypothetical protein